MKLSSVSLLSRNHVHEFFSVHLHDLCTSKPFAGNMAGNTVVQSDSWLYQNPAAYNSLTFASMNSNHQNCTATNVLRKNASVVQLISNVLRNTLM